MKKHPVLLLIPLMSVPLHGLAQTPTDHAPANGSDEVVTDGKGERDKTVSREGGGARKAWLQVPEREYDPDTLVYCDALWMRVHAADSPALILQDKKKTMTL